MQKRQLRSNSAVVLLVLLGKLALMSSLCILSFLWSACLLPQISNHKDGLSVLPGLCCTVGVQCEVTFGLLSNQTNDTLAELTIDGQFSLFSLYQPENDIPSQRAALENLYYTTAGQNWTAGAFFSTVLLEAVEEFAYYYANYTGVFASVRNLQLIAAGSAELMYSCSAGTIYVDFQTFVDVMLLKVPWFTPGFSYCRWWGVECCLTASETSLPSCVGGLQSIGALALAGQLHLAYSTCKTGLTTVYCTRAVPILHMLFIIMCNL